MQLARSSPLRAGDLKPGSIYISPTGRRCVLLESSGFGIACTSLVFRYVTRTGRASWDEGFALSAQNAQAIAALRECAG